MKSVMYPQIEEARDAVLSVDGVRRVTRWGRCFSSAVDAIYDNRLAEAAAWLDMMQELHRQNDDLGRAGDLEQLAVMIQGNQNFARLTTLVLIASPVIIFLVLRALGVL